MQLPLAAGPQPNAPPPPVFTAEEGPQAAGSEGGGKLNGGRSSEKSQAKFY